MLELLVKISLHETGVDPGGDWDDRPPKTIERNYIHHDFVQFGKQHSRHKAILSSIVLSRSVVK